MGLAEGKISAAAFQEADVMQVARARAVTGVEARLCSACRSFGRQVGALSSVYTDTSYSRDTALSVGTACGGLRQSKPRAQ